MRWRHFLAAAFATLTFVWMGVPLVPALAGIGAMAAWNLYAQWKERHAQGKRAGS